MSLSKIFAIATSLFFTLFVAALSADEVKSPVGSSLFATYLDQLPKPAKVVEREEVDPMFSEAGDEPDTQVKGVRALSSENISSVEPDAEAVKALEKFAVDKNQASDFAAELGLKARKVEYLVKVEEVTEAAPTKETKEEDF